MDGLVLQGDIEVGLGAGETVTVWIDCDFAIILADSVSVDNATLTWTAAFSDLSACASLPSTLNTYIQPNGPSDSKPISIGH